MSSSHYTFMIQKISQGRTCQPVCKRGFTIPVSQRSSVLAVNLFTFIFLLGCEHVSTVVVSLYFPSSVHMMSGKGSKQFKVETCKASIEWVCSLIGNQFLPKFLPTMQCVLHNGSIHIQQII